MTRRSHLPAAPIIVAQDYMAPDKFTIGGKTYVRNNLAGDKTQRVWLTGYGVDTNERN